jgi:putative transcriptional regulator
MPSLPHRLFVILAVVLAASAARIGEGGAAESLQGSFLVASPNMTDPRFAHTVIFMIHHDSNGAMGLIVNKVLPKKAGHRVLEELGITALLGDELRVHFGGPVEPNVGFVLHTPDYHGKQTVEVTPYASVTTSADILSDIAVGNGPEKGLFALGYAGWAPGQLENELRLHGWVTVPGDAATLFNEDRGDLWSKTLARRGIEL